MKKINKYIILLLCTSTIFASCEDWLNKVPASQVREEMQFSTESGFQQVLLGCYIGMAAQDLYGGNISWHFPDLMSQQYDLYNSNSQAGTYFQKYDFKNKLASEQCEKIWKNSYNIIANANNALKNIDAKKGVFYPESYNIIKGEFLAIRAFVHFDLMRFFGVSNLAVRTDKANLLTIPYNTTGTKDIVNQKSYGETIAMIENDLKEAISLLEIDPITKNKPASFYTNSNIDGFYNNRELRINYFAAKAILARVYLWEGSVASIDKAKTILDEILTDNQDKDIFKWVIGSFENNYILRSENIFSINSLRLFVLSLIYFDVEFLDTDYQTLKGLDSRIANIYESTTTGIGDVRYSSLFDNIDKGGTIYKISKKYKQALNTQASNNNDVIPLLRLPEVYYMLAECYAKGSIQDLAKAKDILMYVRSQRGVVTDIDCSTKELFMNELEKEYAKEFYAEGGLYFFYKRTGKAIIKDSNSKEYNMDDAKYMLPYPTFEIQLGRVQKF